MSHVLAGGTPKESTGPGAPVGYEPHLPAYDFVIEDSFKVVRQLNKLGFLVEITSHIDGSATCVISREHLTTCSAVSESEEAAIPEAICNAALKAIQP